MFPLSSTRAKLILLALLLLLLILAAAYATTTGAVNISPTQALGVLTAKLGLSQQTPSNLAETIIWKLRFPRIILAILVGAGLSISGAALQGLFRNPLVDPGLIGVSSGAAMGALIALVITHSIHIPHLPLDWLLPILTLAGALLTTTLIYRLSKVNGHINVATMLLAGIAINALAGAFIGLIITLKADNNALRNLTFWMLGSLSTASWKTVALVCIPLLPGIFFILIQARKLNPLLLGENEALHLGINSHQVKRSLIFWSALVIATTVAAAGIIAFIGLVIPHLARLILGPNHKWVFPGSLIIGALLTLVADTAARTIAIPIEIPIGVFTALVGAPFFLALLIYTKKNLPVS